MHTFTHPAQMGLPGMEEAGVENTGSSASVLRLSLSSQPLILSTGTEENSLEIQVL